MEPNIFEPRLKFKPGLKFFKFGPREQMENVKKPNDIRFFNKNICIYKTGFPILGFIAILSLEFQAEQFCCGGSLCRYTLTILR